MLRFAFHRPTLSEPAVSALLNASFAVDRYVENFPHIFSDNSGAWLACVTDASDHTLAVCAVDTEIWSEPQFLRGACIGSVAVAPQVQGRGLGRSLMAWVVEQLSEQLQHDFVYLFSQPRSFYSDLGFVAAGLEQLQRIHLAPKLESIPSGLRFMRAREISTLDAQTLRRFWYALERGRKDGESHAEWSKFFSISQLSGLLVSWLEREDGSIAAGACLGKGIDFKGVMHTFFAETDALSEFFLRCFSREYKELSEQLLVAAGLWGHALKPILAPVQSQALCLVRGLELPTDVCVEHFSQSKIYPRSLFSS